jgi:hypothetical protein
METLSFYRQVITSVLRDLAEISTHDGGEILPLFDLPNDNYLLLDTGWHDIQRIHHVIAHMRILNGKIWVEADNTDRELVQQLLDAGIPKTAIVLAFHSPQKRRLTEFAIA